MHSFKEPPALVIYNYSKEIGSFHKRTNKKLLIFFLVLFDLVLVFKELQLWIKSNYLIFKNHGYEFRE